MFLYFDKKGILKTKIDHGVKARQGDSLEVTICLDTDFFEFIHNNINNNYSTDSTKWSVSVQAQKAGSNQSLFAAAPTASFSLQIFRKQFDSEITYNLVDGQTYYMASFELSEEYTTRYGETLLLSFNMVCQINDDDDLEEIEVIDYQLASALIEVEKTYGRIKTNLTDSEYLALKAMLEAYYSNTGTRLDTIENNYVISVAKSSDNGQKLIFEYKAGGASGNLDFQELYEVNLNSPSFIDIVLAINNNQLPYFKIGDDVFYFVGYGRGAIMFACSKANTIITRSINISNEWSTETLYVETTANRKNNLTNPDNDHYPTTKAVSDGLALKQDTLTFDDTPRQSSNNPVTSNGIYEALTGKQDTIVFNTTYNPSTNKAATMADIPNSVIVVENALPTANATSPDFVQYNGELYRKSFVSDVYSYILVNTDSELYEVTYGVTLYANIASAISNGKIPYCKLPAILGGDVLLYVQTESRSGNSIVFACAHDNYITMAKVGDQDDWTTYNITVENTDNKATNFNTINNTKYPTTQAVKTELDKKVDKETGYSLMSTEEHNKLAGIQEGAEVNVNADWDASSGDAQILNKPNLATVATSGSYNDLINKPVIDSVLNPSSTNLVQSDAIADFVNSSIATNTANFIGTFANVSLLEVGKLGTGSILKTGSIVKAYSLLNNTILSVDTTLSEDVTISSSTSLASGTSIKEGSTIKQGSIINNTLYEVDLVLEEPINIRSITNNDYANVTNSEHDFATTSEMDAYDKDLLTNYDYAWVVNGAKYDLYRFDITSKTWGLRATAISKGDVSLITAYNRYKVTTNLSTLREDPLYEWNWDYTINTSGYTAAQWAAINSGITSADVTKLSGIESGAQVNTVDSVNSKTGVVVLDADNIDDTNTTNKFVTTNEKSTWNAKQDALYASGVNQNIKTINNQSPLGDGNISVQPVIDSSHKLDSDLVDDTGQDNKFVSAADKSTWNGKQDALVNQSNIKSINGNSLLGTGNLDTHYIVDLGTITLNNNLWNGTITAEQLQNLISNDFSYIKFTASGNGQLCLKSHTQTANRILFFNEMFVVNIEHINLTQSTYTIYVSNNSLVRERSTAFSSKQDVLSTTSVSDGTIEKSIGFNSNGDLVKGTVSVDYDTDSLADYVEELFLTHYDITMSVTHCTYTGSTSIPVQRTKTITITPDTGYFLPSTITINGVIGISGSTDVTWSYNNTTGVITLTNATDDLSITVICNEGYEYSLSSDELTITKAPYTLNSDELTIE